MPTTIQLAKFHAWLTGEETDFPASVILDTGEVQKKVTFTDTTILHYPLLSGFHLEWTAQPDIDFTVSADLPGQVQLSGLRLSLSFPEDWIAAGSRNESGALTSAGAAYRIDLKEVGLTIERAPEGHLLEITAFALDGDAPLPFKMAGAPIFLQPGDAGEGMAFNLSGKQSDRRPETESPGWRGVFFPKGQLFLFPDKLSDQPFEVQKLGIGANGFSGQFQALFPLQYAQGRTPRFSGRYTTRIGSFEAGLTEVAFRIKDNLPDQDAFKVKAQLAVPFLDDPLHLETGIREDADGSFELYFSAADADHFFFVTDPDSQCMVLRWQAADMSKLGARMAPGWLDKLGSKQIDSALRLIHDADGRLAEARLDWDFRESVELQLPGISLLSPDRFLLSLILENESDNGVLPGNAHLVITLPPDENPALPKPFTVSSNFAWKRGAERELQNDAKDESPKKDPLFKFMVGNKKQDSHLSVDLMNFHLDDPGMPVFLKQFHSPLESLPALFGSRTEPIDPNSAEAETLCRRSRDQDIPDSIRSLVAEQVQADFDLNLVDNFRLPFLNKKGTNGTSDPGKAPAGGIQQFLDISRAKDADNVPINFIINLTESQISCPLVLTLKMGKIQFDTGIEMGFDWEDFSFFVNHDGGIHLHLTEPEKTFEGFLGLNWSFKGAPAGKDSQGQDRYRFFTLVTKNYNYQVQQAEGASFELTYTRASKDPIGFAISNFVLSPKGINLAAEVIDRPARLNGVDTKFRFQGTRLEIVENKIKDFTLAGSGPLPPKLVGDAMVDIALQFAFRNGELDLVGGGAQLRGNKLLDARNTRFQFQIDAIGLKFVNENGFHLFFTLTGSASFVLAKGDSKNGPLAPLSKARIEFVECPLTGDATVIAKHIKFLIELPQPVKFSFLGCFEMEIRGLGFVPQAAPFDGDPAMLISGQVMFSTGGYDTKSAKVDFHGLYIGVPARGSFTPRIHLAELALEIALGDAFRLTGVVSFVDTAQQSGFTGEGRIELKGLPSMSATFAFLRVRRDADATWLRAWFIYLEVQKISFEIPVVKLFLREVGLGFGYRYTLVSFKAIDKNKDVAGLLKELRGLSRTQGNLSKLDSWAIDLEEPREDPRWTIVLRAMISQTSASTPLRYNEKTEPNLACPILFDAVIAFRSDITFLMAVRAWLNTNYNDFLENNDNLRERPLLSGFVLLAPRHKRLLAQIASNPDGLVGDHPPFPSFIKRAISKAEFSITLLIEPGLFHFEMGWPNMLRWSESLGPLSVEIRGGFIFRITAAEMVIGYSIIARGRLKIEEGIDLGIVGVRIYALAEVAYGARFIGLLPFDLDRRKPAFYGAIGLEIKVVFSVNFWIRIFLLFVTIKIEFGFSFFIGFTASLEVGVNGENFGLRGRATLSIGAMGRSIRLNVKVGINESAVSAAHNATKPFLSIGLEATDVDPVPGTPAAAGPGRARGFAAAALSRDAGFARARNITSPPNLKAPDYSIFVLREAAKRKDEEHNFVYFVILPQGEEKQGDTVREENGFLPVPPDDEITVDGNFVDFFLQLPKGHHLERYHSHGSHTGFVEISPAAPDGDFLETSWQVNWEKEMLTEEGSEYEIKNESPENGQTLPKFTLRNYLRNAYITDANNFLHDPTPGFDKSETLEDARVHNPSDNAFEAAVRGALEQFRGSPYFKRDPKNEYDQLLGKAFADNTSIYSPEEDGQVDEARTDERLAIEQADQMRGMVIHDLVNDLKKFVAAIRAGEEDLSFIEKSFAFQMGLVFRVRVANAGNPGLPGWLLNDINPEKDLVPRIKQRLNQKQTTPPQGAGEFRKVTVFNLEQSSFRKLPPKFERIRQYTDANTIAITWDLAWSHQFPAGSTPSQSIPDHHLLHYRVRRRTIDNSEPEVEYTVKNADVLVKEGGILKKLQPRFKIIDHFNHESQEQQAALPAQGRTYLYTITPVDFSEQTGRPLTIVATRYPNLPPQVPVESELECCFRINADEMLDARHTLVPGNLRTVAHSPRIKGTPASRSAAKQPALGARADLIGADNHDDGTFTFTFRLTLENTGKGDAKDVQLFDDIPGAFYGLMPRDVKAAAEGSLLINDEWRGQADSNLLAEGQTLKAGEKGAVRISFRNGIRWPEVLLPTLGQKIVLSPVAAGLTAGADAGKELPVRATAAMEEAAPTGNSRFQLTYELTLKNETGSDLEFLSLTVDIPKHFAGAQPAGFQAIDGNLKASPHWDGNAGANLLAEGQSLKKGREGTIKIQFFAMSAGDATGLTVRWKEPAIVREGPEVPIGAYRLIFRKEEVIPTGSYALDGATQGPLHKKLPTSNARPLPTDIKVEIEPSGPRQDRMATIPLAILQEKGIFPADAGQQRWRPEAWTVFFQTVSVNGVPSALVPVRLKLRVAPLRVQGNDQETGEERIPGQLEWLPRPLAFDLLPPEDQQATPGLAHFPMPNPSAPHAFQLSWDAGAADWMDKIIHKQHPAGIRAIRFRWNQGPSNQPDYPLSLNAGYEVLELDTDAFTTDTFKDPRKLADAVRSIQEVRMAPADDLLLIPNNTAVTSQWEAWYASAMARRGSNAFAAVAGSETPFGPWYSWRDSILVWPEWNSVTDRSAPDRLLVFHPFLEAIIQKIEAGKEFIVDRQPPPPVQPEKNDKFLLATSPQADPYGWQVLQRFGLSVTISIRKAATGELVTPTDPENNMMDLLQRAIRDLSEAGEDTALLLEPFSKEPVILSKDAVPDLLSHLHVELLFQQSNSVTFTEEAGAAANLLGIVQLSLRPKILQRYQYHRLQLQGGAGKKVTLVLPETPQASFRHAGRPDDPETPFKTEEGQKGCRGDLLLPETGALRVLLRTKGTLTASGCRLEFKLLDPNPGALKEKIAAKPALAAVMEVNPTKGTLLVLDSEFLSSPKEDARRILLKTLLTEADRYIAGLKLERETFPATAAESALFLVPTEAMATDWLNPLAPGNEDARQWLNFKRYAESSNSKEAHADKIIIPNDAAALKDFLPTYLNWSQRFFDHAANVTADNQDMGTVPGGASWIAAAYPRAGTPVFAAPDTSGRIKYDHLLEDQWAHNFRFYIRPFGRYDLLWDTLRQSPALFPEEQNPGTLSRVTPDPLIHKGGLDVVLERTRAVAAPVILFSGRLDEPGTPAKPAPPGRLWEVIIGQHPEQALMESNQSLFRRLAFRQVAFSLLRRINPQVENFAADLRSAMSNPPAIDLLPVEKVYPGIPDKLPPQPDHLDMSRLTKDEELSLRIPERLGRFAQNALVIQWESLPFFYEQKLLVIAQTASTVSPINSTTQQDFHYQSPAAVAQLVLRTEPAGEGLKKQAAILIPLQRLWDALSAEAKAQWNEEAPRQGTEGQDNLWKLSAIPDLEVIYQLTEIFNGNQEVQIEYRFDPDGKKFRSQQLGQRFNLQAVVPQVISGEQTGRFHLRLPFDPEWVVEVRREYNAPLLEGLEDQVIFRAAKEKKTLAFQKLVTGELITAVLWRSVRAVPDLATEKLPAATPATPDLLNRWFAARKVSNVDVILAAPAADGILEKLAFPDMPAAHRLPGVLAPDLEIKGRTASWKGLIRSDQETALSNLAGDPEITQALRLLFSTLHGDLVKKTGAKAPYRLADLFPGKTIPTRLSVKLQAVSQQATRADQDDLQFNARWSFTWSGDLPPAELDAVKRLSADADYQAEVGKWAPVTETGIPDPGQNETEKTPADLPAGLEITMKDQNRREKLRWTGAMSTEQKLALRNLTGDSGFNSAINNLIRQFENEAKTFSFDLFWPILHPFLLPPELGIDPNDLVIDPDKEVTWSRNRVSDLTPAQWKARLQAIVRADDPILGALDSIFTQQAEKTIAATVPASQLLQFGQALNRDEVDSLKELVPPADGGVLDQLFTDWFDRGQLEQALADQVCEERTSRPPADTSGLAAGLWFGPAPDTQLVFQGLNADLLPASLENIPDELKGDPVFEEALIQLRAKVEEKVVRELLFLKEADLPANLFPDDAGAGLPTELTPGLSFSRDSNGFLTSIRWKGKLSDADRSRLKQPLDNPALREALDRLLAQADATLTRLAMAPGPAHLAAAFPGKVAIAGGSISWEGPMLVAEAEYVKNWATGKPAAEIAAAAIVSELEEKTITIAIEELIPSGVAAKIQLTQDQLAWVGSPPDDGERTILEKWSARSGIDAELKKALKTLLAAEFDTRLMIIPFAGPLGRRPLATEFPTALQDKLVWNGSQLSWKGLVCRPEQLSLLEQWAAGSFFDPAFNQAIQQIRGEISGMRSGRQTLDSPPRPGQQALSGALATKLLIADYLVRNNGRLTEEEGRTLAERFRAGDEPTPDQEAIQRLFACSLRKLIQRRDLRIRCRRGAAPPSEMKTLDIPNLLRKEP